ncbi:GNAT family N-acetyltransferase [Planococcus sp. N064]|uniref:GNAT family N-acetyltransferase n=1 Tax=Planococcus liqunii TaxID=3058394 RepID=A0ABT8MRF1_9BACL|nr:GNAT family N-acetyltransferase [Planococcus sp. N064]MDN7227383.1 GNAT family N-acetyltransferase [Planococcus sp. N064]
MEINYVEESDLLRCTDVFIEVFNREPWNDEWESEKAGRYLLDFYRTPGFLGLLATEGEELIGFLFGVHRVWWSGDEFFVHEMCVKSSQQNKGIGKALVDRLLEELEARSIIHLSLLTDRGIPAEAFYKKNGFTEVERLVFLSRGVN